MWRMIGISLAALLFLSGLYTWRAAAQNAAAPTVKFPLSAVDKGKSPATTLKREDVSVFVNGEPREILSFERESDTPLRLALLLDVSVSQEKALPAVKAEAISFLTSALRPGVDAVAILSFAHAPTLEQGLTKDVALWRAGVERVRFVLPPPQYAAGRIVVGKPPTVTTTPPPGTTVLWDSMLHAIKVALPPGGPATFDSLVIITDGVDTASAARLDEVVGGAVRAGVVVYALGVDAGDKNFGGVDRGALRKAAERTGGRAFLVSRVEKLAEAFGQLQQELKTRYVVTLAAPAAPRKDGFHKLRVEITNPDLRKHGIKLAHPHGLYEDRVTNAK
jgi:Ca-activated chloride channel homolog